MTATFSSGCRNSAPWQTHEATASVTGRHSPTIRKAFGTNGSISVLAALPVLGVPGVAAVGGVHRDQHAVLADSLPERVELRHRERARAAEPRHRGRADQDGPRPALDDPVQFLYGLLDDGQADHRGGEDPVLVIERPHLVQPLVERVHDHVDELRVVPHALLEKAGQRREHQRPLDQQLIHELQARGRLAEGGDGAHRLAEDLPARFALGVARGEVLLHRTRARDHLEGGVGDVLADLPADRDLGTAVDLHVLDRARVLLGQVPGERVLGLVQVVIRVEQRVGQHARRH